MEYQLAKKLKEAGFPQERSGTWFIADEDYPEEVEPWAISGYETDSGIYGPSGDEEEDCGRYIYHCKIPTLEELIEACGEDFSNLSHTDSEWQAIASDDSDNLEVGIGKSPLEAVANLWLKLHEASK